MEAEQSAEGCPRCGLARAVGFGHVERCVEHELEARQTEIERLNAVIAQMYGTVSRIVQKYGHPGGAVAVANG